MLAGKERHASEETRVATAVSVKEVLLIGPGDERMLRTTLLATTIFALMGTPAFAQERVNGYVGIDYANSAFDGGYDADLWQADAALGFSHGQFGLQLDGSVGSFESDSDTWAVAGHANYAGSGWRVGAVVAATSFDGGDEEVVYGIEGNYDIGERAVIGASGTLGSVPVLYDDFDTWNIDVDLAFYVTPNWRLGGRVGVGNLENSLWEVDTTSVGLGVEVQPWAAPLSIAVAYDYFDRDGTPTFETEIDAFSVSLRWNFSGGSLRERDSVTPFDTRTQFIQRSYGIN
jgi:hypothetical protein